MPCSLVVTKRVNLKENRMNRVESVASSPMESNGPQSISEVLLYAQRLAPCRCGRCFSEDFEGRLFCRGCEGTDAADITPRLPLCRWSK
jgi:hypothetical protein